MTRPELYKVAGSLAVILLGWWLGRRNSAPAPTGTVELGDPTVTGSGAEDFGGVDYGTRPPELAPLSAGQFATDPEMNRLIMESNQAIADAGGPPS